jgi:hypothetical protein
MTLSGSIAANVIPPSLGSALQLTISGEVKLWYDRIDTPTNEETDLSETIPQPEGNSGAANNYHMTVTAGVGGAGNGGSASLTGVVTPPVDHPRVKLLREAATLITGDREQDYGTPQVNFQRIADLWNVQLKELLAPGKKFSPMDVALAMTQVKMGRAVQTPTEDSFKDAAGYIALAYELSLDKND